ncbi:hypothetical protein Tco_1371312 [Tanacetum coccineum]
MTAFWVVNNQFQKFIDSRFTLDYDSQMTDMYFVEYPRIKVQHFRDTLLQHMGNVKKSIAERTRHQRQYDKRVNKRTDETQRELDCIDDEANAESQVNTEIVISLYRTTAYKQPEIIVEDRVGPVSETCQLKSYA